MTANYLLDQYRGQKNVVPAKALKIGESGLIEDVTRSGGKSYYNSGNLIEVMICKATASLSSPAGKGVVFDAHATVWGNVGAFSSGVTVDGIVDPELTQDLASGDTFLVYRKGPMNIIAGGAISADAGVKGTTGGKFVTASEMAPTRRGRLMVAAGADGDIRRAIMDFTIP
jgi:hypothetical protein